MTNNYWDTLMAEDELAATYMLTYGEGPGSDTRRVIKEYLKRGDTVLDVGCGPGWNMDDFEDSAIGVERYKGVDYSQRFVRVANERRHQKGYAPSYALPFELQDCRDLQEPDKSWDVVIVQDCLEHTNGYEKPIKEAIRVARDRVIVTFWHLTENDDHINDDGNDGYGAWYSRPKWEKFLDKQGYSWVHTTSKPQDNRQHDFYVINLVAEKK